MDRGCYFQVGNALKLGMSIPAAFKIALNTWALWVQNTVDTNRTRIFFRTFEPSHWRYFSNIGTTMLCLQAFPTLVIAIELLYV